MVALDRLFEIIRRLRGEGGCEWDRKQTARTMWRCLAEEIYELEEAISKDNPTHICEELGDVLFQLAFIVEIFNERKQFSLEDVIKTAAEKMIRRHPHVYGEAKIQSGKELDDQWERIKAEEKPDRKEKNRSVLDNVPPGLPSLLRAMKVSKCVVKEGFDWDSLTQVLGTAREELDEFEAALAGGDKNDAMMEFGDVLFTLVNVARFAGFHPETALTEATSKFEGRYRLMEEILKVRGKALRELPREQVDAMWERAKKAYDK